MACPANPNHNVRESAHDLRRPSPRQCPPQGLPTARFPALCCLNKKLWQDGGEKVTSYKEVHPLMALPRAARLNRNAKAGHGRWHRTSAPDDVVDHCVRLRPNGRTGSGARFVGDQREIACGYERASERNWLTIVACPIP